MTAETDPTRTAMTDAEAEAAARRIITDFATSWRDTTPTPQYGTAPPVTQPGRPPMSQKAVDVSSVMLAGSVACVPLGGMACLVLLALDQVDRVSLAIAAGAPIGLALVITLLLHRAKGVLPEEHHHHYAGPVHQQHSETHSRSIWNKNTNQ